MNSKINEAIEAGTSLPVMESFYTIQGEGVYSGRAAWFIRLGGCDVGCSWCDVKESWTAENHPIKEVYEIVSEIPDHVNFAVITGGEPGMYNLNELTKNLDQRGIKTAIETSGAHPLTGKWHWVCLSPKKFKAPLTDSLLLADELKVVVYNKDDFRWAEEHAEKVKKDCKLFLQPEWDRSKKMLPQIIDFVKANPKWNISLQTHKYMDIP